MPEFKRPRNERHMSAQERKKVRQERSENWKNTRGDAANSEGKRLNWQSTFSLKNERFEAFYRQLDCMRSDEFSVFIETLKSPLPVCFHMDSAYPFSAELKKQIADLVDQRQSSMNNAVCTGKNVALPIEQLRWYPDNCGFKLGADKRVIKKDASMTDIHKWLVRHTDNGNITRQEGVSMVPPLALDVHPHHKCIDMCAAPGSKTSQLLEIVNRSLSSPEEQQGIVVANDSDTSRAYMLVHQCRRIDSPLLLVTTHKGQSFPGICGLDERGLKDGYFDRVLCDVPCSGDGTLRKNPAIWDKWSTISSFSLHPLQLMIAKKGISLLKTGGLLVYSTCSMSPYEDEAVVAELLRQNKGILELVDPRDFIPLFKARAGLTQWRVLDDHDAYQKEMREKRNTNSTSTNDSLTEKEQIDELREPLVSNLQKCHDLGFKQYNSFADVPEHATKRIRQSVFPPSEEEIQWMKLEKCMRCLPHDEDTGGFFVATFRKISNSSESKEEPEVLDVEEAKADLVDIFDEDNDEDKEKQNLNVDSNESSLPSNIELDKNSKGGRIDYIPLEEEFSQHISTSYGIDLEFVKQTLFVRDDFAGNRKNKNQPENKSGKTIVFLGKQARDVIAAEKLHKLKIISAGIKVFEKKLTSSNKIEFRLVMDGINVLAPIITKRKVFVSNQDFCNLLEAGMVSFSTLSSQAVQQISSQPSGVLLCVYEFHPSHRIDYDNSHDLQIQKPNSTHIFYAICWKGSSRSINVMCNKVEIDTIKHKLEALNCLRSKQFVNRLESTSGIIETKESVELVESVEMQEKNVLDNMTTGSS